MSPTFLLALCTTIQNANVPKVETLRGAHFEVVAHFDGRKLAEEALVAAEAVAIPLTPIFGPVELARRGAVITEPRMPIHLFWNPAEFAEEAQRSPPTNYASEFAFTSATTRAAYVLITPASVGNALGATGLPVHTKLAVARQAAELWAHRASPLAARWPYWFLEGGATYAAEEACIAKGFIQSRLEYPASSSLHLRTKQLLAASGLPNLFAFVDGFPGGLTNDERRAVASQLFRFLKEPAHAKVIETVAYAARVTKQDDVAEAVSRVLRSVVGDAQAQGRLEASFDTWLRGQVPAWEELHGALWPVGDTWIQAAVSVNAIAWRADVSALERYEITGETAFFPAEHRQSNVLLARTEHTFVAVAFVADHGVDVLEFDARRPESERWKKLGESPIEAVKEGRFIPFKIVANGKAIEVWIDDKPVLSLADCGTALAGGWGLGVYQGSCCAWRNLGFKALP
ncbi:MAG: hypothetical protein SGI72_15530 [Planctomycetota bacterium]|nr:hypothetical protein [Planctomycetota bacterium]